MKVSELVGPQLDWAVAQCEGKEKGWKHQIVGDERYVLDYSPSTNWAQGGPIIEREQICTEFDQETLREPWSAAYDNDNGEWQFGPTLLIAAMRCLCAGRLGDEIEIPEELK